MRLRFSVPLLAGIALASSLHAQEAAKIKGVTPMDPSAVKIYVIQYQENNASLTTLLQSVASQPQAPFYYFAPDTASLGAIFDQIAASLSALRIVK